MNSSLENKRRRRYYTQETFLDKIFSFFSALTASVLTLLESACEFFSRPEIALVIRGICIFGALAIIVGAVGGIESGTLLLSVAMIRILGALAAACVIFKAVGDR